MLRAVNAVSVARRSGHPWRADPGTSSTPVSFPNSSTISFTIVDPKSSRPVDRGGAWRKNGWARSRPRSPSEILPCPANTPPSSKVLAPAVASSIAPSRRATPGPVSKARIGVGSVALGKPGDVGHPPQVLDGTGAVWGGEEDPVGPRDKGGAMASRRQVPGAEVAYHVDSCSFGQRRRTAELKGDAPYLGLGRLMPDGLSMGSQRRNGFRRDPLLCQELESGRCEPLPQSGVEESNLPGSAGSQGLLNGPPLLGAEAAGPERQKFPFQGRREETGSRPPAAGGPPQPRGVPHRFRRGTSPTSSPEASRELPHHAGHQPFSAVQKRGRLVSTRPQASP